MLYNQLQLSIAKIIDNMSVLLKGGTTKLEILCFGNVFCPVGICWNIRFFLDNNLVEVRFTAR